MVNHRSICDLQCFEFRVDPTLRWMQAVQALGTTAPPLPTHDRPAARLAQADMDAAEAHTTNDK